MVGFRFALAMFLVSCSGCVAAAQVHHVVGGDRGWDPDSWSSGRIFSVGDNLWFTYSAAEEGIVELKTRQEYESCDVTNPIRLYTHGISTSLMLNEQGLRYFASSNYENCKNGLKLHVDVQPKSTWEMNKGVATTMLEDSDDIMALAESPSSPSSSPRLKMDLAKVGGALVCLFGFYYVVGV